MTQKKRQLSHFLNFYVFLTVELPLLSHHISVTEDGIIYNYSDTYYISERYDYTYVTETDHSQGVAKEHH